MIALAANRKSLMRELIRSGILIAVCVFLACNQQCVFAQSCGYYVQTKHERQSAQLKSFHPDRVTLLMSSDQRSHVSLFYSGLPEHSDMLDVGAMFDVGTYSTSQDPDKRHCDGPGCRQQPTTPPTTVQVFEPLTEFSQAQAILCESSRYPSDASFWSRDYLTPKFSSVPRGLFRPPKFGFSVNALASA